MSERRFVTDNGYEFVIDEEDEAKIKGYTWYAHKEPCIYVVSDIYRNGKKQTIKLHRLIMDAPIGSQIDHVDGNGLNNRKSNLRFCNHSQNQANGKIRVDNTSGYKGVTWAKMRRKWQAQIKVNGKRRVIGYYDSPTEAGIAYNKAAINSFGEFARLNEVSNGKNDCKEI